MPNMQYMQVMLVAYNSYYRRVERPDLVDSNNRNYWPFIYALAV